MFVGGFFMLKNIFINFNKSGKKRDLNKRVLAILLTLPLTLAVSCNRAHESTESTTVAQLDSALTSNIKSENSNKVEKDSKNKDSKVKGGALSNKTSQEKGKQSSSGTRNSSEIESSNTTLAKNDTGANSKTKSTQKSTVKAATSNTSIKSTPAIKSTPTPTPTTSATAATATKKETISVSLTISLQALKDNPKALPEHQQKLLVPASGYLANGYHVEVKEGTTVLEVLKDYLNKNNIHYDIQDHQFGAYIAGINNIYQFDAGKNSGWMYKVNGVLPNYGVGSYNLKNGDSIELFYTVDYTK